MGSDKNVKLYANVKLAGSNRQVPIVVIDGDDYGYWKHPNELMCFFRHKIGEEVWKNWDCYDEELELDIESCKEFHKLLERAVQLHEEVVGDRWSSIDGNNPKHREFFDEMAKMFYFTEDEMDYDDYTICHLYDEYDLFDDIVNKIEELEAKNETYFVTLICD